MFHIAVEKQQRLLRVRLSGFFDVAEVGAFAKAAQAAVAEMGCESGQYLHLCDITALLLQSQDVADAFQAFINSPDRRSRRLAIVTGRAAIRMQIRRLLLRSDARLFHSVAEAETWLLDTQKRRQSA